MKSAHHNALTSNGKRNGYHALTSQGPLPNRWENPHRAGSGHALYTMGPKGQLRGTLAKKGHAGRKGARSPKRKKQQPPSAR